MDAEATNKAWSAAAPATTLSVDNLMGKKKALRTVANPSCLLAAL